MFNTLRRYNRSVIVAWLFSYLTVLMVPIIISFALYFFSYNQVKTETDRVHELLLQQMEMSVDSKLKSLERLSLEIALNKGISAFSSAETPLRDHQYYDLFTISESLRTYKNANDSIEDIYVVYPNSDTVIATFGHFNSRELHQKLRENDGISYEKWKELFEQRYVNGFIPMEYRDGGQNLPVVVFAHSLVFNSPAQPTAVVLFLIRDSAIMESVPQQKDADMFIVDTENRYIAAAGAAQSVPANLTYEQLQGERGTLFTDGEKGKSAVSYISSKVTGWKFVSVLPAALFNEKMKKLRLMIGLSLFLCLLIGGIVTILFLRRNYMPIQVMLHSLTQPLGLSFNGGSNEYSFLQGAIQNQIHEKLDMQSALNKHRNTIRAHLLRRLLKGEASPDAALHQTLPAHSIQFHTKRSVVLMVCIDLYGKFEPFGQSELSDQKQQMLNFILTNVLEDIAGDEGAVYATEMNETLACVFNFKADRTEEQEQLLLQSVLHQVQEFMRKHFAVEITIALGQVHTGVEEITESYREALIALDYRVVLGGGQIIPYSDTLAATSGQPHHYYYPLSVQQEFIYAVKSGSYGKAEALLEEIFAANFSKQPVSVPLAKCLMYNLASTMLNTLDEVSTGSKTAFEDRVAEVDQLLECHHVLQMKERMKHLLQQVCQWILSEKRDQHLYLIQDVDRYIQQHLFDCSLNISMIGEAFDRTPSYLSKLYKENTGEALLDTINRLRLSKAKELLQEKLTVSEIAGRVGYSDVSTFLRIFKKFEGTTPGKYQKTAD